MTIPLPVIPEVYRTVFRWQNTTTGQTAVNVMHIHDSTGGRSASDVYSTLNANIPAGLLGLPSMWQVQGSDSVIAQVDITKLDGTSATQSFQPTGAKWKGAQTPSQFVPAAACLIKLTTDFRGRAHRGRVYLPFPLENVMSNGSFDGTSNAGIATQWAAWNTAIVAIGFAFVVASYDRKHSGAGAGFRAITGFLAENPLATQRRRQGRLRSS